MQTYKAHLTKKESVTEHVYLLEFKLENQEHLQFVAGQYMMLLCPQPDETNISRLYSVASHPHSGDTFELLVEIVPNGVASKYVLEMNVGDEVQLRGPAGMFTLRGNNHRIFMATGTGIAPIRSMLKDIILGSEQTEHTNFLFWGVQYLKDMYFLEELKSFTKTHPSFEFFICLSKETDLNGVPEEDRKYFVLGRVNIGLEKRLGKNILGETIEIPTDFDYYLCGGRTVIESLRQYLYDKQVAKEHVIFEKF
ncbi:MAG: FAD-dependent oxidoreductase [Patescibacteria group bacterium]